MDIELTQGFVTTVDDTDNDLSQFKWCAMCPYEKLVYATRHEPTDIGQRPIFMHRVILERVLERPLQSSEWVKHVNGDRLNNQRRNLILATVNDVLVGRRMKNNTSGFVGVTFNKKSNKWQAQLGFNYVNYYLGLHDTPEEAHIAYMVEYRKHYDSSGQTGTD